VIQLYLYSSEIQLTYTEDYSRCRGVSSISPPYGLEVYANRMLLQLALWSDWPVEMESIVCRLVEIHAKYGRAQ